jgi:hypothetical protein
MKRLVEVGARRLLSRSDRQPSSPIIPVVDTRGNLVAFNRPF